MMSSSRILALFGVLIALSSYASAFFWGSSSPSSPPPPAYYYQKRLLQAPSTVYTVSEVDTQPQYQIPSVPIQVPLQAQFSPSPNIRNVQLVPCLCPVSQEYEFDKLSSQENVFSQPYQQIPQPLSSSISSTLTTDNKKK